MPRYGNHPYEKSFDRFDKTYVEWYDTRHRVRRMSRRQRADGSADLLDLIDMTDILLESHQMSFDIDKNYAWSLFFPYMFLKPDVGDKILNTTSTETYTIRAVEEVPPNFRRPKWGPFNHEPKRDTFTGLIVFEPGVQDPKITDKLEFVDKEKNLIHFFEWGTSAHSKKPISGAEESQGEEGRFNPTITWSLKRSEPGTIGKRPFDPAKMAKATIREIFPDPQYSYLQKSDGEVQAHMEQNIYPTGTTLTTGSYRSLSPAEQDVRLITHSIEVRGQWFDNLVQFDCWSTSNQEANALIFWLEDFLELYTPVLKQNGIGEMLYWQRLQDQTIERWRNDIENRTLQYYFRTEKLRVRRLRNFRKFEFKVSIGTGDTDVRTYLEPTGISNTTGLYGVGASQIRYDYTTGVTAGGTGHYTGDGSYLWGQLTIEEE